MFQCRIKTKKRNTGLYDYTHIALWNSNRTTVFRLESKDRCFQLFGKYFLFLHLQTDSYSICLEYQFHMNVV